MQKGAVNCYHSSTAFEAFQWLNLHDFRIHRVIEDTANAAMAVVDAVTRDFIGIMILCIFTLQSTIGKINDKREGSNVLDRA